MPTPLHDRDALQALADMPEGAARDWANVRLALAGERVLHLPRDPWDAALCLAAGAPPDGVLERVRRSGRKDADTAELVEATGAFGALPEDAGPWIEALREAIRGAGKEQDLWYARALADLGGLDGDSLSAAAQVDGDDARAVLPALVLRFAEGRGADVDVVAREVAAPLAQADARRPGILAQALAGLGVPIFALELADPDVALLVGVRVAGADRPELPPAQGSTRRRARRAVGWLLHDVPGTAAALVRALADHDEPDGAELVAAAAWLALRPAEGPALPLVLDHGAGEDRALLARARRDVTTEVSLELTVAIGSPDVRSAPTVALAGPLLARHHGPGELVAALFERAASARGVDRRVDVVSCVAMAQVPDKVARFLGDRTTRDLGLLHARYANTEEVLQALLELPVPGEPAPRLLYAWALCDQADRAALGPLRALASAFPQDEALGEIAARAGALLGG